GAAGRTGLQRAGRRCACGRGRPGPDRIPPPLRAVASRRGRERLRGGPQRRRARGDGRHDRRRARLSGEPDGHRAHPRHRAARARAGEGVVVMAINGLPSISNATGAAAGTGSAAGAKSPQETGFAEALGELIRTVDGATGEANVAINRMLDGTGDVHEAMIAMQRAEQMLELTVQVRNKLVQAYQEVMRMSV